MDSRHKSGYKKFALTMMISFLLMYLIIFLNMDKVTHYHTSATRLYMALLMLAPMAALMMMMMGEMYRNKNTNHWRFSSILPGIVSLTHINTHRR